MASEWIEFGAVEVEGGCATARLTCSLGMERYFAADRFWADYASADDLDGVPPGILAIPAVGNAVAVAWALGAELRVDTLDARFLAALGGVGATIQSIYPSFRTAESSVSVRTVAPIAPPVDLGRVGLLYSGGIDSNSALVEHLHSVGHLFTVWGADVPLADGALWRALRALVEGSPPAAGKTLHVVRSNLRSFLNNDLLTATFGPVLATGSWWGGIQHGLGLLSVTAPLAYRHGIGVVMEASSYTEGEAPPGQDPAFSPAVDEQIAWAGTRIVHHGYRQTRQQKIGDVLAPYVAAGHGLPLAACYKRDRGGGQGLNCGVCEKCLRTQAGLLLAGIDPNACGFRLVDGDLDLAIERFERCEFLFEPVQTMMWLDIQRGIPANLGRLPDRHGSRRFFAWLAAFDMAGYGRRAFLARQPFLKARLIELGGPVLRALPPAMQGRLRQMLA